MLFKSEPETIALRSKDINKFYEPLVLLKVLHKATQHDAAEEPVPKASIDVSDRAQVFQAFVYKLAHVCDSNKKGGDTVTAFCVLRDDDGRAHYRFASNQRSREKLEQVKAYVQGLLGRFRRLRGGVEACLGELLGEVLVFNRQRVAFYAKQVVVHARRCVEFRDNGDPLFFDDEVGFALQELIRVAELIAQRTLDGEFAESCIFLINHLESIGRSSVGATMAERALAGRRSVLPAVPSSRCCWSELQHASARILAYRESALFMLYAGELWPALFDGFRVSYCASGARLKRPCPKKSQTAEAIVRRMTEEDDGDDNGQRETFAGWARDLQQRFQLDEPIRTECRRKTFRPVAHAEVMLLDDLDKRGLLSPNRFFNGCAYIGGSKPTCRLCEHYFSAHEADVGRRPSHGNVYLNWRFPDVLRSQGRKGVRRRSVMMERVLGLVREDVLELVRRRDR